MWNIEGSNVLERYRNQLVKSENQETSEIKMSEVIKAVKLKLEIACSENNIDPEILKVLKDRDEIVELNYCISGKEKENNRRMEQ